MNDLDSGVVCPKLRKLHLVRCRLRTNEASSIIKCYPNLSDLAIVWSDFSCIVHELPSDEDWRLNPVAASTLLIGLSVHHWRIVAATRPSHIAFAQL
jgi:hypothetical protein